MKSLTETLNEAINMTPLTKLATEIEKGLKIKNYKSLLKAVMNFDKNVEPIGSDIDYRAEKDYPYRDTKNVKDDALIDGVTLIFTTGNGDEWVWDNFEEEWYKAGK